MYNFKEGEVYTNQYIFTSLSCANAGGIRSSKATKTITIFTKLTSGGYFSHPNPYFDHSEHDYDNIVYTGQGLEGDQQLKANNLSLYNTSVQGSKTYQYKILYFICLAVNEYTYMGEYVISGKYYFKDEKDVNGNMRKVLKFPLKKVKNY